MLKESTVGEAQALFGGIGGVGDGGAASGVPDMSTIPSNMIF